MAPTTRASPRWRGGLRSGGYLFSHLLWCPFKAVAATLKAGAYRSAAVYLQVYRLAAERRGYDITPLLARDLKDYRRSCARGLGGPVRPRPLPIENLGHLSASREPWAVGGPVNPRASIIAGTWWLCREVELSGSRAHVPD